jgi:ankyrin repeat protein
MYASLFANENSSIETVKLLINNEANVNLQHNDSYTALIFVSQYSKRKSSTETVKLLIENEANLNMRDKYDRTALMLACRYPNENFSTIKLLIKHRVINNLQNYNGNTALKERRLTDTIKLLIENI